MQLEEVIAHLNSLKIQILGWPDNVREEYPNRDPDIAFQKIEENLRQLLSQIQLMEPPLQEQINPVILDFKVAITEHYERTRQKLEEMQEQFEQHKQHAKAIKAYTKS